MTDEYTHEDVPDIVGSSQDATQSANAIRRGYAAYVNGEQPGHNPYLRRPGENFSGFKKRKQKLWAGGWKLAAVREGPYESIDAVEDDHNIHHWTPPSPEAALYDMGASDPTPADGLTSQYVYGNGYHNRFETRHECIGDSAKRHSKMPGFGNDPEYDRRKYMEKTTDARVYERERRPLIEDRHKNGGGGQ